MGPNFAHMGETIYAFAFEAEIDTPGSAHPWAKELGGVALELSARGQKQTFCSIGFDVRSRFIRTSRVKRFASRSDQHPPLPFVGDGSGNGDCFDLASALPRRWRLLIRHRTRCVG